MAIHKQEKELSETYMAKKAKRSRRKATRTMPAKTRQEQPTLPTKISAPTTSSGPVTVDLAQEYRYVFADLKKIAIIAAIMFVLLFALAFILR